MKKLFPLVVLLLLPLGFALSVSVKTIPALLKPGTSGIMIIEVSSATPAKGLRLDVPEAPFLDLEKEGYSVDLGDISSGTVSHTLAFSVPENVKPGIYVLPLVIRYEDLSGNGYEEHFVPTVEISSGEDVKVEFPSQVFGNVKKTVTITITNGGAEIYGAKLLVPDAVGSGEVYLGDIPPGETVKKEVTLLPVCDGGVYRTTITLTGYRGTGPFSEEFNFSSVCIPPRNTIGVEFNIPERAGKGEETTYLILRNYSDVAVGPVDVVVSGENVRIGGKSSFHIDSLDPSSSVSFPVTWRLEKADEEGRIVVEVTRDGMTSTYTYSILPPEEVNFSVYLSGLPKWEGSLVKMSVAVANTGTTTAQNVFVEVEGDGVLGGKSLLGDLSPGDYDTVSFYASTTELDRVRVRVYYYEGGERKESLYEVPVSVPKRSSGVLPWLALLVVIAAGIWWYRGRKG